MVVYVLEKCSPCYLEMEDHNKPQSGFQRVLADNSYKQFKHLVLARKVGDDNENVHPYKEEIEVLVRNLKTEFVELFDVKVTKFEDTECVWVDSTSQLEELAAVLSEERVFGVDTEHHGSRSFLGFTALIQISTTSKDYLIDTIALHDEMGVLRPVFADPRICKVFHGANNDIAWLQRDFHIYVVNLFDTAKASQALRGKSESLACLLEKYCGVIKNKALQKGDWRPRPLSAEQVHYARTDSHYLLSVANCLVSELKSNSIDRVIDTIRHSNVLCLDLYKKDAKEACLGESTAASIVSRYLKNQGSFHYIVCDTESRCSCLSKFQRIVRRLCVWREITARVHDESLSFVLSDQAISAIAATLPITEVDMHSTICAADSSMSPSPVVCNHFEDFGKIMFPDSATEVDDFGRAILQWHLGSIGNCPLSMYNYNLLSDDIPKLTNGSRVRSELAFHKSPSDKLCKVLDKDGQFVLYCLPRVIKSYINLGIAELVKHDPPTLKFLCQSRDGDEGNEHICDGCGGEENNLLRYEIIPPSYVQWFPEDLKAHQQVKLVCTNCYAILSFVVTECKQRIAKELGILIEVVDLESVYIRAAGALLRDGPRLSDDMFEKYNKTVDRYYEEGREVTEEAALVGLKRLKKCIALGLRKRERRISEIFKQQVVESSKKGTSNSDDHEKLVVDYLLATRCSDGIILFRYRWTKVFENALHPA